MTQTKLRQIAAALCICVALAAVSASQSNPVRDITILHLNDLHARLRPDADGLGGFAHVATLLQRERAVATASLTLHAGDLVQGTPVSTIFEGLPAFELANHLGLDANCLGNHEFDYGWEKIESFMRAGRFPTVAANVVNASGGRLLPDPYVLRNVGGVRVAIVGALLEAAGPWGPWRSAPIVETLRPVVAEAKTRSDLVIVLGHLERTEIQRVLQELPDVAVVVAGHNHGGMDPIEMNGRIAVHASGYGREVGRLRLRYDVDADRIISHAWNGIPVNSSLYPADASTKRDVDGWEAKVAAIVDVPVGRASRRMGRDEIRERIQSVLLERYKADIAFISRGEIRDIIPEGDLLARHLWNVSPYEDRVVLVEISGRRLVELLNPEQPPASGTGIGSIDSTRQYRVVTIDFFAKQWTQEDGNARFADQNTLLRDVFIDWVKSRGTIP